MASHSDADVIGFGGSAGGGKSFLILGLAITQHRRSLILRRESKETRGFLEEVREKFGDLGRLNENTGIWRGLPGGRTVEFGGVKDPGDENKYKGRPRDLLAIDEADAFSEMKVRFLQAWVRTIYPNQRCRTVLTFNPPSSAEGRWLLDYFAPWLDERHPNPAQPGDLRWYANLPDGTEVERPDGELFGHGKETIKPLSRTFIPARVTDNPFYMATGYMAQLQALPEPLRSQLLYGDMRAGLQDDAWQLIPTAWVKAAQARWAEKPPEGLPLTAIGTDVAYGGADATAIVRRHGPWFSRPKKYRGVETDSGQKAAGLVLHEHSGDAPVNVDVIGYGAACHEALRERIGKLAVAVNVAEAPNPEMRDRSKKFKLTNVRAAMYWLLREALDPESGDNLALPPDSEVLTDLTAPRYEVRASGIILEPKKDIKERIGRSPDVGDAIALAHWQVKYATFRMWQSPQDIQFNQQYSGGKKGSFL